METYIYWPILALFGPKTARKFGPQGPFFMYTWKYSQYACKPNFMVQYQKIFGKMSKNLQNSYFLLIFFVIKDQLIKLEAKDQNYPITF